MQRFLPLFLLLSIFCVRSVADTYRVMGKRLIFEKLQNGVLVSAGCQSLQCEAYRSLAKPRKMQYGKGGMNPGSLICKSQLKGSVVIGVDEKGNQKAFCKFKDSSMIFVGDLIPLK